MIECFVEYKNEAQILSPEDSNEDKERKIRYATTSGMVTLMTRDFARGCDFICNDKIVNKNGGIHVIQTFLSLDKSEEVQCMGRTARQDNQGSYSMVLLRDTLEKFDISEDEINRMINKSKYYDTLDEKRNK